MLVLGYFLLTVLSVGGEDERREVKMFEDIESQNIRDNFDSFPLLRRDVKPSGWCEVSWTTGTDWENIWVLGLKTFLKDAEGTWYS